MTNNIYRGYSSFEFQKTGSFSITDISLVKLDLLNHIFTRKGERVMLPDFGTQIPDLTFEPLDEETLDILQDELEAVFDYDPRVTLLKFEVYPLYDQSTVTINAILQYEEFNIIDSFDLNIEFETQ
jgi:phage baseplate assembly protein W